MQVSISYNKNKKDTVKVSVTWLDLMDMDQTIARILYPLFKKFRANYNKKKPIGSFTFSMAEEVCDKPFEMSTEQEAACLEKWLTILDKVLYSFKALADNKIGWDGPLHDEMIKKCLRAYPKIPASLKL